MASSNSGSRDGRDRRAPHDVEVQRVRTGTTLRIIVDGELDLASAPGVRDAIGRAHTGDAELVVLDFQRVTFIDSSGLHVLFDAHEELNGKLRIISGPPLSRLLDLVNLRDRLPILDS